jgi:hypothetical protein
MVVTDTERVDELKSALRDERLVSHVTHLAQSLEEYKKLAKLLQEQNERLKRGLLGQKAERFSTNEARALARHARDGLRHGALAASRRSRSGARRRGVHAAAAEEEAAA